MRCQGLQWLRVRDVHTRIEKRILSNHQHSLEALSFSVGNQSRTASEILGTLLTGCTKLKRLAFGYFNAPVVTVRRRHRKVIVTKRRHGKDTARAGKKKGATPIVPTVPEKDENKDSDQCDIARLETLVLQHSTLYRPGSTIYDVLTWTPHIITLSLVIVRVNQSTDILRVGSYCPALRELHIHGVYTNEGDAWTITLDGTLLTQLTALNVSLDVEWLNGITPPKLTSMSLDCDMVNASGNHGIMPIPTVKHLTLLCLDLHPLKSTGVQWLRRMPQLEAVVFYKCDLVKCDPRIYRSLLADMIHDRAFLPRIGALSFRQHLPFHVVTDKQSLDQVERHCVANANADFLRMASRLGRLRKSRPAFRVVFEDGCQDKSCVLCYKHGSTLSKLCVEDVDKKQRISSMIACFDNGFDLGGS